MRNAFFFAKYSMLRRLGIFFLNGVFLEIIKNVNMIKGAISFFLYFHCIVLIVRKKILCQNIFR